MALPAREIVEGKARFDGLPLVEWVSEAVARLVAACDPHAVVLFGSVARGDDGPNSDIDLLVIVDDATDLHAAAKAAVRAVADVPPEVDPVVVSRAAAEAYRDSAGTIIRPALREGRVVFRRDA
jgi:predicted nucleotidyltransferase